MVLTTKVSKYLTEQIKINYYYYYYYYYYY